jgi:hypothetical protein
VTILISSASCPMFLSEGGSVYIPINLYCKLKWRHRENTSRLQKARRRSGQRIPRWYSSVIDTANANAMRIPYNISQKLNYSNFVCKRVVVENTTTKTNWIHWFDKKVI